MVTLSVKEVHDDDKQQDQGLWNTTGAQVQEEPQRDADGPKFSESSECCPATGQHTDDSENSCLCWVSWLAMRIKQSLFSAAKRSVSSLFGPWRECSAHCVGSDSAKVDVTPCLGLCRPVGSAIVYVTPYSRENKEEPEGTRKNRWSSSSVPTCQFFERWDHATLQLLISWK